MALPDGQLEWLETNALGSFALGCVDRKLRRKYHALLTVRDPEHGEPWNLLADVREHIDSEAEAPPALLVDPLSGSGEGAELCGFSAYPHAVHQYRVGAIEVERCVRLGASDQVELSYRVRNVRAPVRLRLEPLLRCRPWHALTQENPFLDGTCVQLGGEVRMLPYAGMPAVAMRLLGASARFEAHGRWLPVELYAWEAERGYPAQEALFCPGHFVVELDADTTFTLIVGLHRTDSRVAGFAAPQDLNFAAKLERAASQFWVCDRRGQHGVIAGFPWFEAETRAALIALPGLFLASGDFERCHSVLSACATARRDGLVPDRVLGRAEPSALGKGSPEASLIFARTVQWFAGHLGPERVASFMPVVCDLLEALADGENPRAQLDRGVGLFLQAGAEPATWMDACVDGACVTPRFGYAVDLDALAYNAAHFACAWADARRPAFARAFRARLRHAEGDFVARYWDDVRGYLADGHDGHAPNPSLRPNQLWALGLPYRPVSHAMARSALQAVTQALLVPVGIRTLSPRGDGYVGRYAGAPHERDRAYHQGSAWPWLLGLYADAVSVTFGGNALEANLGPVFSHLVRHVDNEGCIGQISELFDGDPPHRAGGAPAQAFSVAEVYRAFRLLHEGVRSRPEPSIESRVLPFR